MFYTLLTMLALLSSPQTSLLMQTPSEREGRLPAGAGEQIGDLLEPDHSTSLRCGSWLLTHMTAGPACEASLFFKADADDETAVVTFRSRIPADGSSPPRLSISINPTDAAHQPLLECVRLRLESNDASRRMAGMCNFEVPDASDGHETIEVAPWITGVLYRLENDTPPPPPEEEPVSPLLGDIPLAGLIILVLWLLTGLMGLSFLRFTRHRSATASPHPRLHRDHVLLGILAGGLILRGWLIHVLALNPFEFEDLRFPGLAQWLGNITQACDPGGVIEWHAYHAPLPGLTGELVQLILGGLGLSDSMLGLRSVNLLLMLGALVLIVRIGDHLDARAAGRITAALIAFSPELVTQSARFGPYIFEMTFALLFIERILPPLLHRDTRPDLAGIGAAAALTLWSSYLTALLVFPGLLLLILRAPPGRLRIHGLVLFASVLALFAPFMESATFSLANLVAAAFPESLGDVVLPTIGNEIHPSTPSPGTGEVLLFPLWLTKAAFGVLGSITLATGWILLAWTRPRRVLLYVVVVAALFAGSRVFLFSRWFNFLSLLPLLCLLGIAGWEQIFSQRLKRPRMGAIILLGLCLIGPTVNMWRTADRIPLEVLGTWARGQATWFTLVEEVHSRDHSMVPLLVFDPDRTLNRLHLTCDGTDSINEFFNCDHPRPSQEVDSLDMEIPNNGMLLVVANHLNPRTLREVSPPEGCALHMQIPRARLFLCTPE